MSLLPELLGKWFTQPSTLPTELHGIEDDDDEEGPWCNCQTDIEGSDLICCDNPDCAMQWFHMACLQMDVAPEGKWFSPTCWRSR